MREAVTEVKERVHQGSEHGMEMFERVAEHYLLIVNTNVYRSGSRMLNRCKGKILWNTIFLLRFKICIHSWLIFLLLLSSCVLSLSLQHVIKLNKIVCISINFLSKTNDNPSLIKIFVYISIIWIDKEKNNFDKDQ